MAALAVLVLEATPAQVDTAQVEHVRVAFTLNFARYTAWPEGGPSDAFRLCVHGGDSLFAAFSQADGTLIRGRPVRLRRILRAADAAQCDLLYSSGSEAGRAWLQPLSALPVLTVGDDPAFIANGGTIRLFAGDQRLQFDVNLPQAERARLVLSPQLLRLARRVVAEKGS